MYNQFDLKPTTYLISAGIVANTARSRKEIENQISEIIDEHCKDDGISPENKDKSDIIINPIIVYNNADLDKDKIIKDNIGKSGIYL